MLFLVATLLPLVVLTQTPLAKSAGTENAGAGDTPADAAHADASTGATLLNTIPSASNADTDNAAATFATLSVLDDEQGPSVVFTRYGTASGDVIAITSNVSAHEAYRDRLTRRLVAIVSHAEFDPSSPPVVRFIPPEPPPLPKPALLVLDEIPMYEAWLNVLQNHPRPKRADEFLPDLKRIFAEEGVPVELAWLPEIESMFDPRAKNHVGARGLFQFMPGTALEQGLRLRPYDERVHPKKSARAAATLLRRLHETFDSWPLALAAYNAGENRVRRALASRDATTFAEIAHVLPLETRHYVPRVLATLAVREGYDPALFAAPRVTAAD